MTAVIGQPVAARYKRSLMGPSPAVSGPWSLEVRLISISEYDEV
jgi:hypothetical protein